MWAIFESLEAVQQVAASVDAACGYPKGAGEPGDLGIHGSPELAITLTYAELIVKPDGLLWAYPKDPVTMPFISESLPELDNLNDWFPSHQLY